jgi:iron-sulfur cluster assembly protein
MALNPRKLPKVATGFSFPLPEKEWRKNMAITLTEKAAKHINRYLERRGKGIGLRFGVRTTGCSGLAYKLEYVDDSTAEDSVFESHGIKVFVDPKSLPYIDGTELDFAREGLNEGFKFRNPNVKDECGCGESFRI